MTNEKYDTRIKVALAIIKLANEKYKIPVRLFGSMAIAYKCEEYLYIWEKLKRKFPYNNEAKQDVIDVDLIINLGDEKKFLPIIKEMSFEQTYLTRVYRVECDRLLFYAPEKTTSDGDIYFPIEVYFNPLYEHHEVSIKKDLFLVDNTTLSMTDLFLTKLQYNLTENKGGLEQSQINQFIDMTVLLSKFPLTNETEEDSISATRIAKTLSISKNVAFEITAKRNIIQYKKYISEKLLFDNDLQKIILEKICDIEDAINNFPKSPFFHFKEKILSKNKNLGRTVINPNTY